MSGGSHSVRLCESRTSPTGSWRPYKHTTASRSAPRVRRKPDSVLPTTWRIVRPSIPAGGAPRAVPEEPHGGETDQKLGESVQAKWREADPFAIAPYQNPSG